jgi:hypothetical protein
MEVLIHGHAGARRGKDGRAFLVDPVDEAIDDLRVELLAPALWAVCWVVRERLRDFVPALSPAWNSPSPS